MAKKWQVLLHYGQAMAPVRLSLYLLDLDKREQRAEFYTGVKACEAT